MTAATRERKLKFINDCGDGVFRSILIDAIDAEGDAFFTNEQIDKLTTRMVRYERRRVRSNISNRARMAALGEVA